MNSGDIPRVDGRLAMSRSFGDKNLKDHLSSEPHLNVEMIEDDTDFLILASDGLWKVSSNEPLIALLFIACCHAKLENLIYLWLVLSPGNVKPRSSGCYQAHQGCSGSSKTPC